MGEEPGEDVMDDTLPDVEAFRAVGPVVCAFRVCCSMCGCFCVLEGMFR